MDELERVKNKATPLHKSCNKCWLITSSLGQKHSLQRNHWVGWAFWRLRHFSDHRRVESLQQLGGNFPVTSKIIFDPKHICQIKCMLKPCHIQIGQIINCYIIRQNIPLKWYYAWRIAMTRNELNCWANGLMQFVLTIWKQFNKLNTWAILFMYACYYACLIVLHWERWIALPFYGKLIHYML